MHSYRRRRGRGCGLAGLTCLLVALMCMPAASYCYFNGCPPRPQPTPPPPTETGSGDYSAASASGSAVVETVPPKHTRPPLPVTTTSAPPTTDPDRLAHPEWFVTSPPDLSLSPMSFEEALKKYEANLRVEVNETRLQETDTFVDIPGIDGHGVSLPHDPTKTTSLWRYCDPSNTSFSREHDALCAEYLSDLNNMRSIRPQPAYLKNGRTIKFKIFYHHGNITAIVKVSQFKFFYEATSEYLSFVVDRTVGFNRVPPTAFVALPLDFMRAASALVSPLYSHWFNKFIVQYEYTKSLFVRENGYESSMVSIQVWMNDVHSALDSFLAVDYDADDYFLHKFYDPADHHPWPPRPHRLTAIGDIGDRFVFDFLIGNTDRGMNDHNNFVYGGCTDKTACRPPKEPWLRTVSPPKYAFLDHGSSFYSHKEPEGSPFTGNDTTNYIICRYRKSIIDTLAQYRRKESDITHHRRPLIQVMEDRLPKKHDMWQTVHHSVFKTVQDRAEKIVRLAHKCVERFGADKVYAFA